MVATWYWETSELKTHLRNSVQHRDYIKNLTETRGALNTVGSNWNMLVPLSAGDHGLAQVWKTVQTKSLLPRPSLLPCCFLFPRNHSHQAKQCRQYHNLSIRFPWKKKAYHPEIFHTWDINLSVHSCLTVSKKTVEGRYMNFLSTLRDICNTETETYIMCVQKSRWVFQ